MKAMSTVKHKDCWIPQQTAWLRHAPAQTYDGGGSKREIKVVEK